MPQIFYYLSYFYYLDQVITHANIAKMMIFDKNAHGYLKPANPKFPDRVLVMDWN